VDAKTREKLEALDKAEKEITDKLSSGSATPPADLLTCPFPGCKGRKADIRHELCKKHWGLLPGRVKAMIYEARKGKLSKEEMQSLAQVAIVEIANRESRGWR